MTNDNLLQILYEWNFWNREVSSLVGHRRAYLDDLVKMLHLPEVKVLTGVRRSGKTTLMYQLINHLISQGHSPQACLYVNFEEPAFLTELNLDLLKQIYRVYRERICPNGKAFLFLDEIQHLPAWEKWVRAEYDKRTDLQIFVSGSNSSLMQSEFSTLLTGRNLSFQVRPLSFREFLSVRMRLTSRPPLDYFALAPQKAEIKFHLMDYLAWGGFPETLARDENEKKRLLQQYFDDIINKDIIARYRIRETFGLKRLAAYLMQNSGNLLSLTTLQKSLEFSKDTGKEYLSYLEDAGLLHQTLYFAFSLKKSMSNNRKIYACDTGLRNAVSYSFTKDYGRLAENLVYLKLRAEYEQVFYWKQTNEVDFVVVRGNQFFPINVCYSETLPPREMEGLTQFMREFKTAEAWLISEEKYGKEEVVEGVIHFLPLWYFLLNPLEI